jgi:hypothetical protein
MHAPRSLIPFLIYVAPIHSVITTLLILPVNLRALWYDIQPAINVSIHPLENTPIHTAPGPSLRHLSLIYYYHVCFCQYL